MKTIHINTNEKEDKKIVCPESWHEVTLSTYEKIIPIDTTKLQGKMKAAAILCNINYEDFEQYPVDLALIILDIINFAFESINDEPKSTITIDNNTFYIKDKSEITVGEWVDIESIEDINFSEILAIICRPAKEEYDYTNAENRKALFANMPMDKIFPVMLFFYHTAAKYEQLLALHSMAQKLGAQSVQNLADSLKSGNGTNSLSNYQKIIFYYLMKSLKSQLYRL